MSIVTAIRKEDAMAAKRGRPRKEDADRLTPTEERLLGYIASECFTKEKGSF